MKLSGILMVVMLALLGGATALYGQQPPPGLDAYNAIITRINADITAGKHTETDLADDLRQLDALQASAKGQDPSFLAFIALQKGLIYLRTLENPAKATAIFQEIQTNYPTTPVGTQMDEVIKSLAPEVEKQKIRESLVPGTLLPDFNTTDLAGKPLSVAQYRGKVVLIDFWATWCPPCRRELPNVVAVYNQYHAQGFEVIGVTLDQDQARVASFIKDSNMPWPEHFEGTGWDNTLVAKYGVVNIPDNILIDAQGHVLGRALTGDVLAQAVAKALVK